MIAMRQSGLAMLDQETAPAHRQSRPQSLHPRTRLHTMPNPRLMVVHEAEHARFIAQGDGGQCVLEYRRAGNTLHITHTEVPPALQGRGL
ncbi:MAG: hypothetical protein CFE44_20745, partial [Burkholderiales bacterium PBB4]